MTKSDDNKARPIHSEKKNGQASTPPRDSYVCQILDEPNRSIHISIPPVTASDPTTATSQIPITTNETTTSGGSHNDVPESVLQYERQMRKVNAAKRASQILTKEQHLKILYEDSDLIVTNKPSGILCVPGINNNQSLLDLVFDEYINNRNNELKEVESIAMKREHMICHRLDMDTSGLVLFGRSKQTTCQIQEMFREGHVDKQYEALVCGHVWANRGTIDLPLQRDHEQPPFMRISTPTSEVQAAQVVKDLNHAGWKRLVRKKPKPSQTKFQVLERFYLHGNDSQGTTTQQLPVTRLRLIPVTGRTHQLRVHCAAMGHAIVGDPTYGLYGEASPNGGFPNLQDTAPPQVATMALQESVSAYVKQHKMPMCLHAKTLTLDHPTTKETVTWKAPCPF